MFSHLTHIKANHTVSRTKEFDGQLLGQLDAFDTSWSTKRKSGLVFKPYPVVDSGLSNFQPTDDRQHKD